MSAIAALAHRSAELSRKPQLLLMDARARWALFEGRDGDAPLGGAAAYRGDRREHRRRVWRGAKERITRRCGGKIRMGGGEGWVIETKADEGRVECVPSDKQEHGS